MQSTTISCFSNTASPTSSSSYPLRPRVDVIQHCKPQSCYLYTKKTTHHENKHHPRLPLCRSSLNEKEEEYLLDAPVSVGDGFSFTGGKYSDEPSPSDEWLKQGRIVKAYQVGGSGEKAKDPIFGLAMGSGSQSPADVFRWFCVETGNDTNPTVILIHGVPSQAYSYRKVLPVLSKSYRAIAFDWLGFGFSDKPQPRYGFDYTLDEYVSALQSLVDELAEGKVSLVVQGYFAPVVVKFASLNQERVDNIILLNPPLVDKHTNLPATLAAFSNFLLGEIFCQDPIRASDKVLTSCGPYAMKEEDAMVYRRPYLTSGSAGFALNALSKAMKKDIKACVETMRSILSSGSWKVPTTICWGKRDRWLASDGVEDLCSTCKIKLVELPMVYRAASTILELWDSGTNRNEKNKHECRTCHGMMQVQTPGKRKLLNVPRHNMEKQDKILLGRFANVTFKDKETQK